MVAAINDIGHSMGRLTIAEYVESEAILRALREMGVEFVQGFHVGRPEPWAQHVEHFNI
jgi:EAL domain-containing protein (putative c-di-GMP-specific phosphodiesterase class I)